MSDAGFYVVAGPPGTGKTTYLSRQVARMAGKIDGRRIRLASLTKTAARAIKAKIDSVPEENVGTLHSLAFHMIGRPELATNRDHVKLWNDKHPDLAIDPTEITDHDDEAPGRAKGDDPYGAMMSTGTPGQEIYEAVCLMRNLRVPEDVWDFTAVGHGVEHSIAGQLVPFWHEWRDHMERYDLLDFTGFIERAIAEFSGTTSDYMFLDEAQDFSTLEQEFVDLHKNHVKRMIMVGDPDQALYEWRGADWSIFDTIEDTFRTVLGQSYRVPRAPHAIARSIILQCDGRRDAPYNPREADGDVEEFPASLADPRAVIARLHEDLDAGGSAMVLASCGYMLDELIGALRTTGTPFHNPYRLRNGRWNPLGPRKGTPLKDRLLAFVDGDWSKPDVVRRWADVLTHCLVRGMKKAMQHEAWMPPSNIADMFSEEGHAARAWDRDLSWWLAHLPEDRRQAAKYPVRVYENNGACGLTDIPKLIIGTIHSVKGGEADHVYVAPDLSFRGMRQLENNPDALHRLFYVATTRCRESLRLLWPAQKGSAVSYWT